MSVLGLPLALFLLIGGVIVLIASVLVHWVFIIVGVVLILLAVYVFVGGSVPGL